ncbi:transcriptional regulator with XRE-family HTH domain [Jatrophihabitans sp. GAS493]|uniref:helix-turn-helix domain-containing protein n=1 Tax=Jatrophihabitans sp. GAS493 TaxID=1907575 RepID=UPI000BB73159|nr:helix-turn-helix transcriptional regulator [Jatrophihabitans sp. GAS493]SOD73279.1 transcriptional regulator with XRE-family HTH domain [Jatrophihabitans sp. GAS493]
MVTDSVGKRIAAYRRRRGLSQAALAGLVGRSESWLSQVERGVRSVDKLSVLLDMARVLHVDVEALTGKPWQYAPNGSAVADGIGAVRQVFTRYDHLLGVQAAASRDIAGLRASIAALHGDYQAARYDRVIGQLPSLLGEVERHRVEHSQPGEERETSLVYISGYVLAAKLVTKLGVTDLAMLAADRAASAAYTTDSLTAVGTSAYQVACALLRADQPQDAEHLSVGMAERVEREARSDSPAVVSVAGALWLISAVIAARQTNRSDAWERLDRASRLAGLLGEDANHAWTGFGPTNVAIHRVSVAAELGDPGEALRAAADVDEGRLPPALLSRRAQVHLDLAWAQSQRKRDAEATLHLLEAERVAPEAIRHNVIAQELVREMLSRGTRSKTRALADLAGRAGLLS